MAHRGGEGLWPSNTLYAFQRAVELGVDALELDIHLSADGALIVRHDPVVESTCNGRGAIQSLSLTQIKALDAGYTWTHDNGKTFPYRGQGITIPTLEEVFAAFPNHLINIDIKPPAPQAVDKLVACIRQFQRERGVRVGSFHNQQLARFRRQLPEAATAAGENETRLFYLLNRVGLASLYKPPCQAFQVPEWSGHIHLVTPSFVHAAHRQGIEVHVWTVDLSADMRRLFEWGVDGLISDYPDRLMRVVGEYTEA